MSRELRNALRGVWALQLIEGSNAMYRYFRNCVGWDLNDVSTEGGLSDMIEERIEITRKTFLRHVDREDMAKLEEDLCYARHPAQGLTMAADWAVEYFRSELHGKRCYGFRHSAIEYVFTNGATQ